MYLQVSPLVLHREQAFSYASLVQQIFRFRHASHLRYCQKLYPRPTKQTHGRSFLDLYLRPILTCVSVDILIPTGFVIRPNLKGGVPQVVFVTLTLCFLRHNHPRSSVMYSDTAAAA